MQEFDELSAAPIAARYELVRRLGSGGMGHVFLAYDPTDGRHVAIKMVRGLDAHTARRFAREVRIARTLNHVRCVPVYDSGVTEDGLHYLVMEHLAGGALALRLNDARSLSIHGVAQILRQVAEGLAYAHRQEVVHRDLKPGNILLVSPDSLDVKLSDFGLARTLTPDGSVPLTADGQVLGTVSYLSPEQARGEVVGTPSDIYAWGVLAFRMLHGRLPFERSGSAASAVQDRARGPEPPPSNAPSPFSDIVRSALSPKLEARPTAAQLVSALEAFTGPTKPIESWGVALVDDDPTTPDAGSPPTFGLPKQPSMSTASPFEPVRPKTFVLPNDAPVISESLAKEASPARRASSSGISQDELPRMIREWRLDSVIGQGGHGTVYRAHHTLLGRKAAVKMLHPELSTNPTLRTRFLREAVLLTSLDHPHIVRCDTPFEEAHRLYLPMEFLDGRPLDDLPEDRKIWPVRDALRLIQTAADAVGSAHAHGVIHRDLKPSNLFLCDETDPTSVKVLDFGVAAIGGAASLTGTQALVGTPKYLSPEVLHGGTAQATADVYALGLVLYELLTGDVPFDIPDDVPLWTILSAIHRAHEAGLTPLPPSFPQPVRDLLEACLASSPAERPEDGKALADAIERILSQSLEWAQCPHCGLRHRLMPDVRCPRCRGLLERQKKRRAPVWAVVLGGVVSLAGMAAAGIFMARSYQAQDSIPEARIGTVAALSDRLLSAETESPSSVVPGSEKTSESSAEASDPESSPTKGDLVVATYEVRSYLQAISLLQMKYFEENKHFVAARPDGVGGSKKTYFRNYPCPKACNPENPTRCNAFACLGLRPVERVYYRYACSTQMEPDSGFTCAAVADLDGDGRSKMFVWGTGPAKTITVPVPEIGDPGTCRVGKTPSHEVVDCAPDEW